MEILPVKTDVLQKNFDLFDALVEYLKKNRLRLKNGDIIVLSSKIVALAQNGVRDLSKIKPSAQAKKLARFHFNTDPRIVELVLQESDAVFPPHKGPGLLTTLKNNILIPAAGIDLSNAPEGFAIVWPKNPQQTAHKLWQKLRQKFRIKNLGIVICDSHCQPLRWGTTGLALAWAGFLGVEDARGQKDIYGKKLKLTRKAVADNLASAALIVMGEAGEKIPFALVRGAPVKFTHRLQKENEIFVKPNECIYSGIYAKSFSNRRPRLHPRN